MEKLAPTQAPECLRSQDREAGGPRVLDVIVIGAGFGGLGVAIKLHKIGFDSFLILEKGADVGGTWRDNTYPGCGCDVPSHLYSFSFELNPEWTRMYPVQSEIWAYLQNCARKYDLLPKIHFHSEVREAVFDESAAVWRVRTANGAEHVARFVVSCMGGLCRPKIPTVPGIDSFEGPAFHSSQWDHDFDLKGKRVAVIGTGASAIQFVPIIAPDVEKLYLFQRSPPWVLPKPDWEIKDWQRDLFRNVRGTMRLFRWYIYWVQESVALGYTLCPPVLKFLEKLARRHLDRRISDPELRERLTPDFSVGCKRTLISNHYYPALERENIEVVIDSIREVREHSVVTTDGTAHEVDALIFGTGFKTMDLLSPVRFVGRNRRVLNEEWKTTPEAYLGVTCHGYPNLFFLVGPNSRVANNSIVFMIEAQIHYVINCLRYLRKSGARTIEVKFEAQAKYNKALQERMSKTVFVTGCNSWYKNEQGKSPILWPSFSFRYWMRSRRVKFADFDITNETRPPTPAFPRSTTAAPAAA